MPQTLFPHWFILCEHKFCSDAGKSRPVCVSGCWAAVTEHHRPAGLHNRIYFIQFWRLQV